MEENVQNSYIGCWGALPDPHPSAPEGVGCKQIRVAPADNCLYPNGSHLTWKHTDLFLGQPQQITDSHGSEGTNQQEEAEK